MDSRKQDVLSAPLFQQMEHKIKIVNMEDSLLMLTLLNPTPDTVIKKGNPVRFERMSTLEPDRKAIMLQILREVGFSGK